MALILHLTDLHLGTTSLDTLDDYKSEFVPIAERVTRHKVLTSTLSALSRHLTDTGQIIDAVLISGDVTYANGIEGFEALAGTLEILGDRLPPTERIVVVPGNHDVKWGAEPSSPECEHDPHEIEQVYYMEIIGHGIDLVDVERVASLLSKGDDFLLGWFTDRELEELAERATRPPIVAGRVAAKEAVVKALGSGFNDQVSWQDVEILSTGAGSPTVHLSGGSGNIPAPFW